MEPGAAGSLYERPSSSAEALTLAEDVVLLSLAARRGRARSAVRVAVLAYPDGPASFRAAVARLVDRGLLVRRRWPRTPMAADPQDADARASRLRAVIRAPATPKGRDAELLALVAAAGVLPVATRQDAALARMRLVTVDRLDPQPPALRELRDSLRAWEPGELAERLFSSRVTLSRFANSYEVPGGDSGSGSHGGHGGHGGHDGH
jgi:hypothetical protein